MPSVAMSSSRPTNGLTYAAPTLAAISACVAEKISVTLTRMPSPASALIALTPSRVNGTFTTTCSSIFASSRPSAIMPGASVATTSALTGPCTSAADLLDDRARVAALLRQERRIGRDAVDDAERHERLDVAQIAGVDEDFHEDLSYIVLLRSSHRVRPGLRHRRSDPRSISVRSATGSGPAHANRGSDPALMSGATARDS